MKYTTSVIDIIRVRQSKRNYRNDLLADGLIVKINQLLDENSIGPLGNTIEFKLIEKEEAESDYKVKLGTYGFISGAKYFIAGAVDLSKPFILEDYGFLLEKIVLHLTDLGLGTCWLGGTFNRSVFARVLGSNKDCVIPAITPVGYPTSSNSIKENLIRWGAKSNSRKPWDDLFFNEGFSHSLQEALAEAYQTPLEMLRLAPSASNKQPWRVVMDGNGFHFYLLETPGYSNAVKAVKLQRIDMGIAMSHFDETCRELNLAGSWKVTRPSITCKDEQYLVSWLV
jgi:hypothetical protein